MEGAKAGTGEGEGVAELRQGQSQEIQVVCRMEGVRELELLTQVVCRMEGVRELELLTQVVCRIGSQNRMLGKSG